jgi:predicted alpha/beta-hydrolase family hydrolase
MSSPLLVDIAKGLAARGHSTLRFNFPYTEAGRRAPDRAPMLEATLLAVLDWARDKGFSRIVLGGRSMGARYATIVAAKGARCDGLLLLAYPLHPAREPAKLRTGHLPQIEVPMLFLSGSRDALMSFDVLRPIVRRMRRLATLHVLEGADHSFAVLRSTARTIPIVDEVIETADAWLKTSVAVRPRR